MQESTQQFSPQPTNTPQIQYSSKNLPAIITIAVITAVLSSLVTYMIMSQQIKQPQQTLPATPTQTALPTQPDGQNIPVLTIEVIDTITKQTIENASVYISQQVVCPAVVGVTCQPGFSQKEKTDKYGKAKFYNTNLKEMMVKNSFRATASQQNYVQASIEIPFNNIQTTYKIELIGGNIKVKTKDSAIVFARKDNRVSQWLTKHPNANSETYSAKFEPPYWLIEYVDKSTCETYDPTNNNCVIFAKIDARNGEIIEVKP